jgi:hypothetical protein
MLSFALVCLFTQNTESSNLSSFVKHIDANPPHDGPATRRIQMEADAAAELKIPKVHIQRAKKQDQNSAEPCSSQHQSLEDIQMVDTQCLATTTSEDA